MKAPLRDDLRWFLTLLAGFIIGMHVAVLLHELGHALGRWLSGGSVSAIVMLAPLPAGYVKGGSGGSDLMSVWGGVTFGSFISLAPLLIVRLAPRQSAVRFAALMIAAFCLGHNAAYLFVGGIAPFSDVSYMVVLGAPRWLLFVLGILLLVAFVFILTAAVRAVGLGFVDSVWRRMAIIEAGLLLFLVLMLMGALLSPSMSSMRLTMLLLVGTYALCFGVVAVRCGPDATSGEGDLTASQLTPSWSRTFGLMATALLVIVVEWVAFAPR